MSSARWAGLLAVLVGCAPNHGEFSRYLAAATRAYGAGRYEEAARGYEEAAMHARQSLDRDEALYRQAQSLRRAGRLDAARRVLDGLLARSPHGERAARAAYERALIDLERGDVAQASDELDEVIRVFPDSGLAAPALAQRLRLLGPPGSEGQLAYLDRMTPALERREVGQSLHYAYAEALESQGRLAEARSRYLLVADHYPYPSGALWDDALWHAADLAARLGEPRAAISYLERMLREREGALVAGSYERGRYAEAQERIAQIHRDLLRDPDRARAAYERLWTAHPKSRLRDEGAWNAARLAAAAGDHAFACRMLHELVREAPESRYVACAPELCGDIHPAKGAGTCRDYILRELRSP